MPSLYRIIRGANVRQNDILPLALRNGFPEQSKLSAENKEKGHDNRPLEVEEEKEIHTRQAAEKIIREAHQTAERIMKETKEKAVLQLEKEAQKAREEGFQKGYQDGYKAALEEAEKEAGTIRHEAKQVLVQAKDIWRSSLDSMEDEIVLLAREIAEKILSVQLTLDPEIMLAIVRESLKLARNKDQVIIYVNPDQVSLVQEHRQELLQALPPEAVLHIIADADIEPGGCRVESKDSKIDATLASRWKAIIDVLPRAGKDKGKI